MTVLGLCRRPEPAPPRTWKSPGRCGLLLIAGWSLTKSAGLPVAAYAAAAWLDGRDAGLVAGLVAIWLTAVVARSRRDLCRAC
jgi:hypothetical protein